MNARLAPRKMLGFTLLEMIVVMVITGIIASVVAVFIRSPIQGYLDTVRRSEMTDTADNALRRIGRDLRLALPNSVRVQTVGNLRGLEFLLTRSGGRYRAQCSNSTPGGSDPLVFGSASDYPCEAADNASFDVLGPPVAVSVNDAIAIFNLGIPGADAYAGDTLRTYNGAGGSVSSIGYTGGPFPFASPGNRFQVVQGTVSYVCDPLPGTGQLNRYSGYARTAAQAVPPAGAATLLAENVSSCEFTYAPFVMSQRAGLLTMTLTIRRANMAGSNESVTLYHTVHVSNVP